MVDDQMREEAAAGAGPTVSESPEGREVGLREARGRLGEMADQARYLDQVTYLTKHGTRVAAVVATEAARTRDQIRRSAELSTDQVAAMRAGYEGLLRAGEATLSATEVLWVRAYLRVWKVLDQLTADFYDAVERAFADEKAAEHADIDHGDHHDPDQEDTDPEPVDYLKDVTRLKHQEKPRLDFAADIDHRVQELQRDDARHPGQGQALDWLGWAQRIEKLASTICAAGPARDDFLVASSRKRLADALAEAAAMLGDLETTPPADPPPDVTGYTAKELWTNAAAFIGGPLMTTIATLAKGMHLPTESVKHALVELHQADRIRCYRYFHGHQTDVNPAHLHDHAGFHLVLNGPPDKDWQRPRVIVAL